LLLFPSRTAFGAIGLLALPFTLLPLLAERKATDVAASDSLASMGVREAPIIIHYALLAFLYVGIEASVGNWMSTYAARSAAWTFAGSTVAVAIFWAAIVVGRATTPAALAWTSEVRLYRGAVIAAAAGIGLLLLAHSGKSVLVASAITGLALAPVFPLILASFLREIGPSRNAGWVFAMAGVGGAVLSWLTGVTSSSAGSLRIGLLVPGAAALLMVALLGRRPMQRDSRASANIDVLPSASEFTALQHAEAAPGPNGRPFPKNL
jgi:FHS family glucose/mannose:H+ symporter-like MFS transporter